MVQPLSTNNKAPLHAIRVLCANAIALFGRFAIDMPTGVFGGSRFVAQEAWLFSFLVLSSFLCGYGFLRRYQWASTSSLFLLSFNCGVFLPALTSDPIKAAGIISWQLYVMLTLIFSAKLQESSKFADTASDERYEGEPLSIASFSIDFSSWLSKHRHALQHLTVVTALQSIALIGFEISEHPFAQVLLILMNLVLVIYVLPFLFLTWKGKQKKPSLVLIPLACAVLFDYLDLAFLVIPFLLVYHVSLFFLLFSYSPILKDLLNTFTRSPALFVVASFVGLIGVGALFLSFPVAGSKGVALDSLEAFFTSVSAVCVTGLSVIDVSARLSIFGQVVLLVLMQLGGIGIMVLSTFATLIVGGRLGLRTEQILGDTLGAKGSRSAYRLVIFIVITTIVVEAVGAFFLTLEYHRAGLGFSESLWLGVFHAVSAFCNAGFSLHSDSLVGIQNSPWFLTIYMALIMMGGLGFVVLLSIARFLVGPNKYQPVPLQVKLVMQMTILLTVSATFIILIIEWNHGLASLGLVDKFFNALFQSVTLRTAGFNSIDFAQIQPATVATMLIFMFIGAAPGGTGGGIKVTTAAVVLASLPALVRRQSQVTFYRRRIPLLTLLKSIAVVMITLLGTMVLFVVLLWTQDLPFEKLLFEIFSAIGTVGLSLGVTSELTQFGKLVLIAAMFLGRVGPLTVALAFAHEKQSRLGLPEEPVMVG